MRTPPFVCSLIVWCFAVLYGTGAAAQECDRTRPVPDAVAALTQVEALEQGDCLGGPKCNSAICKATSEVLAANPAAEAQLTAALRALLDQAATIQATKEGRRLATRMGIAVNAFVEESKSASTAWAIDDLKFFADEQLYEIDITGWVNTCRGEADCTQTSARAQQVIELATLFRRILNKANQAGLNLFAAQLEQLDLRWRTYLGSSRGQYPWELLVNSIAYRKTAQFDAPPTSQWILAHPGAGYELTRSAPDRQPSESLLLEIAGVYRWAWAEEKMRQRWGGSVTLAWRDAGEGRQKLGYGVLAYLPRQSTVGYVWRPQEGSDEHSLVLSADLVKFIRGTQGIKERLIGAR